jgi:hypothetical protein
MHAGAGRMFAAGPPGRMEISAGISFQSTAAVGEVEDVMTEEQQVDRGEQAFRAFERELPQLWEERPGQWVAYRGEERLGFATQKHELYQRCFEQGLVLDEFFIFCIEPFEDVVYFGVDAGDWGPDGQEADYTLRGQE